MSSSVDVDLSFEDVLDVDLSGIPTSYAIDITHIPKIQIGLDPVTVNPLDVTVRPLDLTVRPLDVTVRIREFPSIRAHVPANFSLGLSVLGYELACLRLCGEAQVITEPYDPNPCERCGEERPPRPTPSDPTPQPVEPPG